MKQIAKKRAMSLAARKIRIPSKSEGTALNNGDTAIRNSLAKELLAVCFDSLKKHGLSPRELRRFADEAMDKRSWASASTSLMGEISCLARLLSEWTENPRYVDATGRPKVLPIAGKTRSFEELARRYFETQDVQNVIRIAMRLKAIERRGKHRVAHLGSCVLLTGNRTLLLSHAVRAVRWFLATSEYNAKRVQTTPWPERQAFTQLPEEKFGEFLEFMREPIINLVEMGNRWLLANASLPNLEKDQKKNLMGVHAYVFRDS